MLSLVTNLSINTFDIFLYDIFYIWKTNNRPTNNNNSRPNNNSNNNIKKEKGNIQHQNVYIESRPIAYLQVIFCLQNHLNIGHYTCSNKAVNYVKYRNIGS